ncbi:hypothetical protein Nepgr_025890 [Nepenthes gracilis]|uniref:BZIP domain-containing protein n=1 Tax=Nepenthes gracilis TaxID=150966 RepID=A0AAD3T8Q1_NEPGR|nr:hypothetical protein Nepgr_025890 [Nepenthes gracilis]
MSAAPAIFVAETMPGTPLPDFGSGFTPWETMDGFPSFDQFLQLEPLLAEPIPGPNEPVQPSDPRPEPPRYHAGLESDPDGPNRNHCVGPNRKHADSNSRLDDPNQIVSTIDERKRKRKESNRESARRSRLRKQKHLENLRSHVNRLKLENRELTNRLRALLHHCHLVRSANDRLRAESVILQSRLTEIRRILQFRQLQQFPSSAWPFNSINELQIPSLIS